MNKISNSPVNRSTGSQGLMKGKPCVQKTGPLKVGDPLQDKVTKSDELKECEKGKEGKHCHKGDKNKETDDKEALEKKIAELEKQIQDMQKEAKADKGGCSGGGGGEKGGGGSCGGAKGASGAKDGEDQLSPDQQLSQLADAALQERMKGHGQPPTGNSNSNSKSTGAATGIGNGSSSSTRAPAGNGPAAQKLRQAAEKYRNDPNAPIQEETKRKVNRALGQQFFDLGPQPKLTGEMAQVR